MRASFLAKKLLIDVVGLQAVEKALGEQMPHVKPERKTIEKAIKAVMCRF